MKKLNSAIALVLIFALSLFFSACGEGDLPAPSNLVLSENTLTWDEVESARLYRLSIRNTDSGDALEDSTRNHSYSLSELDEGNYEIRVMAVGGSRNRVESPWSKKVLFEKQPDSGLVYRAINNNTAFEISRGSAAGGDVVLPDEYQGKPVTQIGAGAFRANGKLTSVKMGKNIAVIGENAFYQCPRLTDVEFTDSVIFVGASAFQGCSELIRVALPDSLTVIPDTLFAYCIKLEEVDFGNGIVSIGASAFYSCSALKSVSLPDSLAYVGEYAFSTSNQSALESVSFGSGLRSIAQYAFSGCGALKELTFSETADFVIDKYAFANCISLRSVQLPEGLIAIGDSVFYGDSALESVEVPDSLNRMGAFVFDNTALYQKQAEGDSYKGLIYVDNWLVSVTDEAKESIEEISEEARATYFPDGVVGFAAQVFSESEALKTFYLPASVKYLGDYAFYECPSLYMFVCPAGSALEEIGYTAFGGCATLSVVKLETSKLKVIGEYAFYNCTNISASTNPHSLVPESVERIGAYAFRGTSIWNNVPAENKGVVYAGNWVVGYTTLAQSDVNLKDGTEGVADYAFMDCTTLSSITGFGTNTRIGTGAFYGCTLLMTITLPRGLKKIESATFRGCTSLISIAGSERLPSGITEIGDEAFTNCYALNEIDFSGTQIKSIGDFAFYNCYGLTEVNLGQSLETIGMYAFYGLGMNTSSENLQVSLPDTLRSIGERGFAKSAVSALDLGEGIETIGAFAFRECSHLEEVEIPSSVKVIGEYAFYKCPLGSVVFNEGLEEIGDCAFYGNKFSSLVLPMSLKIIGDNAFRECNSLDTIVFQGEVESVGANAFYNCVHATVYASAGADLQDRWDGTWNSTHRPVVWNCEIENGKVISVTLSDGSITDPYARYGMQDPYSSGERFLGWSRDPEATGDLLTTGDLRELPAGTTVYAIYAPSTGE